MFDQLVKALPFVGSIADNLFAKDRQEDAQAFSAEQYAKRYQTQVADMKAAGINPMLSVSQGPGSSPTGAVASPGSNFTQAAGQLLQNKVMEAQARKLNAEANVTEVVGLDQAKATLDKTMAEIGLTAQQTTQVKANTDNIVAQLQNIKDENMKIKRATELLYQQANSEVARQLNYSQQYELIKSQIQQVIAATELSRLDIDAAKALDNLGRTSSQLKPIVDMLRVFLRR